MQTTGTPCSLRPWYSIGAIRPVSNTTRRQAGALDSTAAIAPGADDTFAS
jgi:hypothetical protein